MCATHGGASLSHSCLAEPWEENGPTRTNVGAVVWTGTGTGREPWEPMAGRLTHLA